MAALEELLGSKLAGTFTGSQPHTPRTLVIEATEKAKQAEADCVISFGGSSVVDLAKSIILTLAEGEDFDTLHVKYTNETGLVMPPLANPKLPHIALPTTLSGSEYTFAAAMSDEVRKEKDLYFDPKLVPKYVFHDPTLCMNTPDSLWAGTGMKIVSDCLEMICARQPSPITDMFAAEGLRILLENLPSASSPTKTEEQRQSCLFAAFLGLSVTPNASLGLVAALRHQLGAHQDVSHGEGSTIVLPHVLKWNLSFAQTALASAARRIGVSFSSDDKEAAVTLVGAVEELIDRLSLPKTLKEVGVSETALSDISERVVHDFAVAGNPRPVSNSEEVLQILRSAY